MRALQGCPQSPLHHGEGDVWNHLRLVLQELVRDQDFRQLPERDRHIVYWAALFHDVAKPVCTEVAEDGIHSRGHARKGALMARRILWEEDLDPELRESACALIAYHMVPFWMIEEPDEQRLLRLAQSARCDLLSVLARADARGRICQDGQRLLDNIELFGELARERGVWSQPFAFPDEHSRVTYFRQGGSPERAVFRSGESFRVLVLSGLPASGKDTWLAQNWTGPVISLDQIRSQLGVAPSEHQAAVLETARQRAREHLRQRQSFAWNATNLSRDIRSRILSLALDYGAEVELVYLECPWREQERRNSSRPRPVPGDAIERMLRIWDPPDLCEGHRLNRVFWR